jgi:hypothetical protein
LKLRLEYNRAIQANSEKFAEYIIPIKKWYKKHIKGKPHPLKVAAEVYVAVLGFPQLFIEGNPIGRAICLPIGLACIMGVRRLC